MFCLPQHMGSLQGFVSLCLFIPLWNYSILIWKVYINAPRKCLFIHNNNFKETPSPTYLWQNQLSLLKKTTKPTISWQYKSKFFKKLKQSFDLQHIDISMNSLTNKILMNHLSMQSKIKFQLFKPATGKNVLRSTDNNNWFFLVFFTSLNFCFHSNC